MVKVENIVAAFEVEGSVVEYVPFGNGHINKTYVTESRPRLIVQEINTNIFKDPVAMMDNIVGVTQHLGKKLAASGVDTTELLSNKINHPTRDMNKVFAYELVRTIFSE